MKTKPESSTQKAPTAKKPQIFRFSIVPTIIKSVLLLIILLFIRFVVLPQILFYAITYVDQIPIQGHIYFLCRLIILMLILLTILFCIRAFCKKLRIKKGSLMYRHGLLIKRTKVYPLQHEVEYYFTQSLIQKIANVSTLVIFLPRGEKKKEKKLVFRNLKNEELFVELLSQKLT